jgi:hypothetical protein
MAVVDSGGRTGPRDHGKALPVEDPNVQRVDLSAAWDIDEAVHVEYTFDDGLGGPDTEGWTTHDWWTNTEMYFHVDDFAGLDPPYAPLAGSQSLWCGVEALADELCDATWPGYGNYWRQTFESVAFPVTGAVSVSYQIRFDMEANYDYAYTEYLSKNGIWQSLISYTGIGATTDGFVLPADSLDGTAKIRFRFESDGIISDEDGSYDTNGAVVLDNVTVSDGGGMVDFQDFEAEAPGDQTTSDGDWTASVVAGFGDFAALFDGSTVLQEDPLVTNTSYLWGFFNGSTYDYTCGGHPEQAVVPYTEVPGSRDARDYIDNEIRSPLIDLSTLEDGSAVPPDVGNVLIEFDVYRDLPDNTVMVYDVDYQFIIEDCEGRLRSSGFWYRGDAEWFRWSRVVSIPEGATHFRLALGVLDACYAYCGIYGDGSCHTHAPLFDNVKISRTFNLIMVTNTNDSGLGSLRQAITDANASPDTSWAIAFDIPGTGPHTIQPLSPLPPIGSRVVVDGYSQPGASPNSNPPGMGGNAVLKIELDGTLAGSGISDNGMEITGGNSVIRGLCINRFGGTGVYIDRFGTGGSIVEGCYIGTDITGTAALSNSGRGILVDRSPNNLIGGTSPGARNVISGNAQDGIHIYGAAATGNRIEGNFIGVDVTGANDLGNTTRGVNLSDAREIQIGGTAPGAGNVVSGNNQAGVSLYGPGTAYCVVEGNLIGTDATGTAAVGNSTNSVMIWNGSNRNFIGGTTAGSGNVIAASLGAAGVAISAAGADSNVVLGNYIGTDITGTIDLGNRNSGVWITDGSKNIIGDPGAPNVIAFNQSDGITLLGGIRNTMSGNSIHSNLDFGIDIDNNRETLNDYQDPDVGTNNLQNFPVITAATVGGAPGSTNFVGNFNSIPHQSYRIEFFANSEHDPYYNYGEGEIYVGKTDVNTDISGDATFDVNLAPVVPAGYYISATATDMSGNTSEFSAVVMAINTKTGSNVVVVPVDGETGETPVTLTFETVTSDGITSVTSSETGPPLPGSYAVGDSTSYLSLSTTAGYSGEIEICIEYDEDEIGVSEDSVVVLHYDETLIPPAWVDITSSVDTVNNIACGISTTGLSPFVAGYIKRGTGIGGEPAPTRYALHQNVPNPFNPSTVIRYDVPAGGGDVTLVIYDVAGRLVRTLIDGYQVTGRREVTWDGRDRSGSAVSSGVYFYRLVAGDYVQTRKMILLK